MSYIAYKSISSLDGSVVPLYFATYDWDNRPTNYDRLFNVELSKALDHYRIDVMATSFFGRGSSSSIDKLNTDTFTAIAKESYGFPNTLLAYDPRFAAGEKLTISNGSYITFYTQGYGGFFLKDGTQVGNNFGVSFNSITMGNAFYIQILATKDDGRIYHSTFYDSAATTVNSVTRKIDTGAPYIDEYVDFTAWFDGAENFIYDSDPYSKFGTTETDSTGGDGDGYETGDAVAVPSVDPLNSMSALGTGMLTVYSPTKDEMKSLYQYLWSDTFDVNSLKKIWANPFDVFMGFSVIPCTIPTAGTKEVVVGNQSTGVNMTVAAQQYIQVDCGTLEIRPSLGAYTDFEPFTKVQIYLPYCGTYPLSMDDINSSTVHVVYNIDIISGSCTAIVELQNRSSLVHDATYPDAVIYEFTGNMAVQLPLTGNDYRQMYSSMISFAGKMAGAIGAATAGNVGAAVNNAVDSIADTVNMKPVYNYGGNLGSNAGRTAVQTPYLIFTQPVVATPERQNTFTGLPAWFTAVLGDLSGFTKVREVHLSSTNATESERNEIYQYLESGVIL